MNTFFSDFSGFFGGGWTSAAAQFEDGHQSQDFSKMQKLSFEYSQQKNVKLVNKYFR